jgi:hypothetical protein
LAIAGSFRPVVVDDPVTATLLCQFREILALPLSAAIYALIHPTNLQFAGRSPQAGEQQRGATGFHHGYFPYSWRQERSRPAGLVGPSTM